MKPKRVPITDNGLYNIIRTEGRQKSIFKPNLDGKAARAQLKHWKNMARNSGGRVFFDIAPVPTDLAESVNRVGDGATPAAA